MSLLAPWALLLAAAAGVPLVLHLLRRRTGTRVDFPAVRYLLRADREHAREVRLRNLLLMLLRLGIVLAVAMAAARPIGPFPGVGHAPAAIAIVLDDSRSSAAAGAGGPVHGRLVAAAERIVRQGGASDRLWLVTMDGGVVGGHADAVRDALARARPLDGAGDADATVRRAAALVRGSEMASRRVVVLTDGQATQWSRVDAEPLGGLDVVVFQPAGEPPANRAVLVAVPEPASWSPRGAVRTVIAGADSTTWRVQLDGRTVARGSVAAGGTVTARVQPGARGWLAGAVEIAPDEYRADDVRHFAVYVGDPPRLGTDAASGPFLRGAVEALVLQERARRGDDVLLVPGERARRQAVIFGPSDPLRIADANRALERAGIPWRFGARRAGPAPLRGDGVDGAVAHRWYPLLARAEAAAVDTLARVGAAPWAVAGDGYVLVASAASEEATDLPVRAAFVPWLDALITERLARSTGARLEAAPGRPIRVPAAVDALERADGTVVPMVAGATIEAPAAAGVHFWRRGADRAGALVVNGEPEESDLARLAPDDLARRLGAPRTVADAGALGREIFAAGGRRALAPTLLAAALLLLLAETVAARRRAPREQAA